MNSDFKIIPPPKKLKTMHNWGKYMGLFQETVEDRAWRLSSSDSDTAPH